VDSQYPLEVGGEDFKLDLLFYHVRLRCFVVIDLKMGPFDRARSVLLPANTRRIGRQRQPVAQQL
jgi:predicted nuclease of restriction endonuclease-like (RecB) superfamily